MRELEITRPDDWHLHLRDGAAMSDVVKHTAGVFGRAIIMPNLLPPVVTTADAEAYRRRIMSALPADSPFEPLMTLYLTDSTRPEEIRKAHESGVVKAVKLYPAGATTNSESGVTDLERVDEVFEELADLKMPLLVHGEVTDGRVDVFDRESVFIRTILAPLVDAHPGLRVVFEHATTADAISFVEKAREGVAATITPHHLLLNRNAIFAGGVRPHHYCLPVLKRERHRLELLRAATSGNPRFFLGTDSAPHERTTKERSCGCAGVFSAHAALALYAEAFEEAGALEKLEAFAAFYGPDFYGLPRNSSRIVLRRESWEVPDKYSFGAGDLVPLKAGERILWTVEAKDAA